MLKENGGGIRIVGPLIGVTFGQDEFYFSILGTPSTTEPWQWRLG